MSPFEIGFHFYHFLQISLWKVSRDLPPSSGLLSVIILLGTFMTAWNSASFFFWLLWLFSQNCFTFTTFWYPSANIAPKLVLKYILFFKKFRIHHLYICILEACKVLKLIFLTSVTPINLIFKKSEYNDTLPILDL